MMLLVSVETWLMRGKGLEVASHCRKFGGVLVTHQKRTSGCLFFCIVMPCADLLKPIFAQHDLISSLGYCTMNSLTHVPAWRRNSSSRMPSMITSSIWELSSRRFITSLASCKCFLYVPKCGSLRRLHHPNVLWRRTSNKGAAGNPPLWSIQEGWKIGSSATPEVKTSIFICTPSPVEPFGR